MSQRECAHCYEAVTAEDHPDAIHLAVDLFGTEWWLHAECESPFQQAMEDHAAHLEAEKRGLAS